MAELRRGHSGLFHDQEKIRDTYDKDRNDRIGIENDIQLEYESKILKRIKLVTSNSSCFVEDITGFVFGPFTSRFWLMRKHINQTTDLDLNTSAPFYAWDCLTLQTRNKGDVYLIIRDEKNMVRVLKFLIYSLRTVDGRRGTAQKLIEQGIIKCKGTHHDIDYDKAEQIVRHQIMMKVLTSYTLMKVRQKMSFYGLMRKQTMLELLLKQILYSIKSL